MSDDGGKARQSRERRTTRRPVEASSDPALLPQEVGPKPGTPDPVETPALELPVAETAAENTKTETAPAETAPAESVPAETVNSPLPSGRPNPPPPSRPSLALLALLLGGGAGLFAGLLGGVYGPGLLGRSPAPDIRALQRLESEVAALANRPAASAIAPVTAPATAPDALQQRLAETEAATKTELQTLSAAVAELRARAAPPPSPTIDLAPLTGRLDALEQAAASRAAASLGAPIYVVTMGLAQVAQQGRGFAGELSALEQLGIEPARLAALKPYAATGLPSAQRVAQEFLTLTKQLNDMGAPKAEGAMGWARSLVKVRAPGGDALGVIDVALRNGDIPAAIALLDTLPEAQKAVAAPFAASLRAHLAAQEAIGALQQSATAGLQTSAPGKPAP